MSARHKQRTRAVSPARPARPTSSLSPTARISARSHTSASQPSTPESSPRLRSLTNSGGASLNHALSFSSLKAESASAPPVRITSKVSGVAKAIHANDHAPTPRLTPTHRNRTPSGSSNISVATSPPTFYPITTATPAANPHRYAPPRPTISRLGSPFGTLRVDPSTPPLSPPISSISISSQSSAASHAAGSSAAKDGSSSPEISPAALARTSSINGHHRSSSESQDNDWGEDDDDNEERKVKAAAKSNRKIEDLEITNRSLMAINASLEKTKNKQAKEIRELRRKLRESRLILPPHAYRTADHDDTADEDDREDEDDDAEETEETDDVFLRLKAIVENLLESGRRALETNFGGVGCAAKVLSAEEARSWRRNSLVDDDHELDQPPSPSRIAVPDSDDDDDTPLDDEDMISSSGPQSPPIFITPSP